MATTVGLYYPYIHFDDDWIKLAALYWDRIARIIPKKGYETRDSPTVQELRDDPDAQFIWDEAPGVETEAVGKEFLALLNRHPDSMRARYGLHRRGEWDEVSRTAKRAAWRDLRLAYVYNSKIWADLTGNLVILGLAESLWEGGEHEWIGMHPDLASVYMTALADAMARQRHMAPVTDEDMPHLAAAVAAAGWGMERIAGVLLGQAVTAPAPAGHTPAEIEEALAHVALMSVVPTDLNQVPVKDIIKARKELRAERLAFQERLRQIVQDEAWLQQIADPVTFENHLALVYENELQPHLERLEKEMGLLGIGTRRESVSFLATLPKVVVEALTLGGLVGTVVGAGASIAGSIIPMLGPKATSATDDPAQRVAYLLAVKQRLTPREMSETFLTRTLRAAGKKLSEDDEG